MLMTEGISIGEVARHHRLRLINEGVDIERLTATTPDINRPALPIAGFFEYFAEERIQIIGIVEYTYLQGMGEEARKDILRRLFERKVPCVILCRGLEPFPEMVEYADEFGVALFQTEDNTSDFMSEVVRWLKVKLAPRVTMHGVLVDIYGEGVLITGESGVGKSEAALELIKRGHRLVADDAVYIKRVSTQTLIGEGPDILKYFLELRGIGIIDVKQMFGVQAIKATQNIDLVIKVELWDNTREYDRLGDTDEYIDILGNKVICHSVPIRPGRNLAVICESAAINNRQKRLGYHAAKVFSERVNATLR